MKNFLIITGCAIAGVVMLSCNQVRRNPGHAYMPDMAYSVAYETYAPTEERLGKYGAAYNHNPVPGTIARGDMFPYALKNDSAGYIQSAYVMNPLTALDSKKFLEASRLYLVNCGICHGAKLDGNGPLFNGGNGPYSAAPRNFMDPAMKAMPEGTMFHSVTYGRNQMGSYASQLTPEQRWMIIAYIKEKQKSTGGATPGAATDSLGTAAKKDTMSAAAPK